MLPGKPITLLDFKLNGFSCGIEVIGEFICQITKSFCQFDKSILSTTALHLLSNLLAHLFIWLDALRDEISQLDDMKPKLGTNRIGNALFLQ